jgi:hypothetical protein
LVRLNKQKRVALLVGVASHDQESEDGRIGYIASKEEIED